MSVSVNGKLRLPLKFFSLTFFSSLILLTLISCGIDGDSSSSGKGADVPDGAIWTEETIRQPYAPPGYSAVVVWGQAPTMEKDTTETAFVEIDYMRVIERDASGNETIVTSEEYNDGPRTLTDDEGGLYVRDPSWFKTDEHTDLANSEIRDGVLTINSTEYPNNIPHWWTDRVTVNPGCRYYVRARVRVTGEVAIQFGSDWWRSLFASYIEAGGSCTLGNNCEAWISYWINDTAGEFVIVEVPTN